MSPVTASVEVPVDPATAFRLFTLDVDRWWRRGERYGGPGVVGHRFDGFVGGRFVEVTATGESALGVITRWEPPSLLEFTWRQGNWSEDEVTYVEVSFSPGGSGTIVRLEHRGFELVESDVGCDVGYERGWAELLGWLADAAQQEQGDKACT